MKIKMKTKNVLKIITVLLLIASMACILAACAAGDWGADDDIGDSYPSPPYPDNGGDEFTEYTENAFVNAAEHPVSYFAMDVSTASYTVIRAYINNGYAINKDMVKLEEMINYFNYSYPAPKEGEPLSVSGSLFPCPWNSESLLYSVGVKAKDIEFSEVRNNLVFLIDTSGSMDSSNKLPLLQEAFRMLADNLNDGDIISIVTYAGSSTCPLEGVSGSSKTEIKNAITRLTAGGSTAGAGGIRLAYEIAERYYIEDGNNRVILATDGDFNVGISRQDELKTFISEKRDQSKGVYLSILGFGLGNFKNTTMDTLAQNGNGAAYYIDSLTEAKKVLVDGLAGTLITVADDVKASVEFNPDKVERYRLLGYETKLRTEEDWNNDAADAGEIGAGHVVTAVYEIQLAESYAEVSENESLGNNISKAAVRYKEPYSGERPSEDDREVKEISCLSDGADILTQEQFAENEDLVFITCVIEFGLIIMDSQYKGTASLGAVITRTEALGSVLTDEYRADFLATVKKYAD